MSDHEDPLSRAIRTAVHRALLGAPGIRQVTPAEHDEIATALLPLMKSREDEIRRLRESLAYWERRSARQDAVVPAVETVPARGAEEAGGAARDGSAVEQ